MMDRTLPERLALRLRQPLPGPMVGTRYEPRPRRWPSYAQRPADARRAAVLLLLYPHEGRWHIPLTLRRSDLTDHAGQVSLPGGAVEPGETDRQAALREFHEELGAADAPIELLGRLSQVYVGASNYLVSPWVAVCPQRPAMRPEPREVAALIEAPLDELLDDANFGSQQRGSREQPYTAGYFRCQQHQVWGATCMILGELVELLREPWPTQQYDTEQPPSDGTAQ